MALTKVPSNLDATVAITQSASDNSTNVATTAYVTTALANLVDGAPSTLNTLDEIAAALNDDAALNTTLTTSIATKLPLAGGTMSGTIAGFTSTGIDDNAASVAITIDSNQNIGIGETSPTRRLSVRRDTGITSGFNDISEFLDSTLGAGGSISLNIGKAASNKNLGKMAFKYAGNASNDNKITWGFFDNDNLMTLAADGRVSIGAAAAGNVGIGGLRLYSNIEETLAIDGSAGTQAIHFYDAGTRRGILGFSNGTSIAPAAADHDMVLRAETGSAIHFAISATSYMNIDSSGNVGIGDISPSAKLDVSVSGSGTQTALILNNSHGYGSGVGTAAAALQFRRDSGGGGESTPAAQIHSSNEADTTSNPSNLVFSTKNSSGTLTEAMRIDSSGNVGIGQNNPVVKLEIGENNSSTNVGYIRLRGHNALEGNIYKTATYGLHFDTNSNNQPIRIDGSKQILGITGNVGIGTENPSSSAEVHIVGGTRSDGPVMINRSITNGSLFFGAGIVDANHAIWNGYNGDSATTRGGNATGFDGMLWNTYRGLKIRGGTGGASNCLVIENSSSNNQDHTVKLFASGTERLATNTTGVAINGNITVSGTGDFTGKVDFQGTAAIEGGTSGSGYGVFKGYSANANHMLISRGKLSGTNTSPTITGGHEMTLVEYVGDDASGFVFKSSHVANSAYTEKVAFRSSYNLFQAQIRCVGAITANYSDERLKDVHGNIKTPLEKIQQLNGFYYTPNNLAQELGYEVEKSVGVSAQEVQKVMPEVVKVAPVSFNEEVEEEYLTVQYEKLVPLLIESIKEQQTIIDDLKARIEALEG